LGLKVEIEKEANGGEEKANVWKNEERQEYSLR
jgi:hypothetical protein